MLTYIGIVKDSDYLKHYGRLGMKWGKHIFGDDPRWGLNGRGRGAGHSGKIVKTEYGDYDTEKRPNGLWTGNDELRREAYYQARDKKLPLSKLKKSADKLSSPPTLDEVQKLVDKVNPHHTDPDAAQKGYMGNCVKCSMCTVLRLKGYDAVAYPQENDIGHPDLPGMPFFSTQWALDLSRAPVANVRLPRSNMPTKYNTNKWEANSQRKRYVRAAESINRGLRDGDYGYISSKDTRTGNGHNSNFIKINGKTYGIDGQIGKVQPLEDYFDDVGWTLSEHMFVVCTDAQPNEIGVGRFVDEKQFKK